MSAPVLCLCSPLGSINLIFSNEEARNYLSGWGLKFDTELVKINARQLPPEKILQFDRDVRTCNHSFCRKERKVVAESFLRIRFCVFLLSEKPCLFQYTYRADTADWSREMRNCKLISPIGINRWTLIYTNRDAGKAREFLRCLQQMGPGMGIQVTSPKM